MLYGNIAMLSLNVNVGNFIVFLVKYGWEYRGLGFR